MVTGLPFEHCQKTPLPNVGSITSPDSSCRVASLSPACTAIKIAKKTSAFILLLDFV